MYIGDKMRDQYVRHQIFKEANEHEEAKIESNQVAFLEHIQKFEDQIKTNATADPNAVYSYDLPHEHGAGQKKSLKDFKPLKTKTFTFNREMRQMSASGATGNDYFQKADQDKSGEMSTSAMGASGALAAIMLNKSSHPSLSKLPPVSKETTNVRRHLEPTTIPGLNN